MAEQNQVEWPLCEQAGCIGVSLAPARRCLAHSGEEAIAAALKLVSETGAIDARGVPVTRELFDKILAAAPRGRNGEPLIDDCRFDRAIFRHGAWFEGVTFRGVAEFAHATFRDHARFDGATFAGGAEFGGATFSGGAWFGRASFDGSAWFGRAIFNGHARFARAAYSADARFDGAVFNGSAGFDWATFGADACFEGTAFNASAVFDGAVFNTGALFGGTIFKHRATFVGARFEQARYFGPMIAHRELLLDEVQFAQLVHIELSSIELSCRGAQFQGGVHFGLRWARVMLEDTDLAAPSILTGIARLSNSVLALQEAQVAGSWRRLLADEISERPQLISLRWTNVAGLGLSNVSAADCRFAGAHNLDKLRLEADVAFACAPQPMRLTPLRRSRREVIAEEITWRASRSGRHWVEPKWPAWLDDKRPHTLDPGQIAGLYRALRKGREDGKDEPGAADFYYGEMEMRRARPPRSGDPVGPTNVTSRGRTERGILTVYWLLSGYGLRASRALIWLTIVTALLALAFYLVGFAVPPRPVSYWTSLLFAFRATVSLTDDQVKLTQWGQLLQGVLRLTGPVLLGLALLALRGRVKR